MEHRKNVNPINRTRSDRPQLQKLLAVLRPGDVLLVTRLDRLARSTRDLLNVLDNVAKAGASFRSIGDAWCDTTTPHGRLMLTVLGGQCNDPPRPRHPAGCGGGDQHHRHRFQEAAAASEVRGRVLLGLPRDLAFGAASVASPFAARRGVGFPTPSS
jgi:hypothetical protein